MSSGTAPDSPVGDPILVPLQAREPATGPDPDVAFREARHGLDAVTGGGLAALVDPTRGLRSLWQGPTLAAEGLLLRWGRRLLHPATGMRMDGGGWERWIPLPGGGTLVERAVLVDTAPALLLHWIVGTEPDQGDDLDAGSEPRLDLELAPPAKRPALALSVDPNREGGAWVAVLPPGSDPDRYIPRLLPPAARERARRTRPLEANAGFGFSLCAEDPSSPHDLLASALEALDRSPLGIGPEGRPRGPFLIGVREGRPVLAEGSRLVELALGFLQAGRTPAAWCAFEALLARVDEGDPSAAGPVLHVAGELAAWTGDPGPMARHRPLLDRFIDDLMGGSTGGGHPEADLQDRGPGSGNGGSSRQRGAANAGTVRAAGAAFPGPHRILETFASGIERLGGDWHEQVQARRKRTREASTSPGPKRMPLPVLSASPAEPDPDGDDHPASLPHPRAFQPVDAPGTAPRRGLHAARLVRAWVEGVLGVRPDAAYGRLELAPDLREGPEHLQLRGLSTGDARVDLDCRLEGPTYRFRLFQEGGRVPVNLVFEPRLPLEPPLTVHLDGEPIEVTVTEVEGGTRISCQFPLDSERRMIVEQAG